MKMEIKNRYGTCIVPANTILFSSPPAREVHPNLFFGLTINVARKFQVGERGLLAFRIKYDFELLFMIRELTNPDQYISSADEIFSKFYPASHEPIDYLTIKMNVLYRNRFEGILKTQNISGWLTSLENMNELEIYIFGGKQRLESVVESIHFHENEYQFYNALKYIEINPSTEFINLSKKNFHKDYCQYLKDRNKWKEDLIAMEGYSTEQAEFEIYDLRLKLRI